MNENVIPAILAQLAELDIDEAPVAQAASAPSGQTNLPSTQAHCTMSSPELSSSAALASAPPHTATSRSAAPSSDTNAFNKGVVTLDSTALRHLRQSRLMSQQDMADDCWRRNIRVSIATIKRAETGHAVRFRIARELARCLEVPVMRIVRA